MAIYWFSMFEKTIRINCDDDDINNLVIGVYEEMQIPAQEAAPDLDYVLTKSDKDGEEYCMARVGETAVYSGDDGLFLYLLEKDMTIALEILRSDLYFLHAAALEYKDKIHLLIAESGGGKSTTAWALLHHGFNYSSDELAPVVLENMTIHRYPHALCQKTDPPEQYPLPPETMITSRTMHVPVDAMPCKVTSSPMELSSIFFVQYDSTNKKPSIVDISAGEATARVYANGLNQLAHDADGLIAAERIARHARSFHLNTAALDETAELVKTFLDKL